MTAQTHPHGCNKSPFSSFGEAQRRAKKMRAKHDNHVEAYHCRFCGKFHIGESDKWRRGLTPRADKAKRAPIP